MRILAALLLGLVLPLAHAGQALVPLTIGGTTLQYPLDPGYESVSGQSPRVFAITQAALPPTNRLVEIFESSADVARARTGNALQDVYFQVQVMREIESRQIGIDDWNELKPQLTAGMSKFDVNSALAENSGSNARMSTAAGQSVAVNFGRLSEPSIYRETAMSVSFSMIVPFQMNVGGNVESRTMGVACAMLVARNRLVNLYAFSPRTDPSALGYLRSRLNATVDETLALNPSDSSVASTGAFSWLSFGRTASAGAKIGGLIGALVAIAMILRNLKK